MTTNVNFLPIDVELLIRRTAEATAELLKGEMKTTEDPSELLTPKEACDVLRCSIPTLWRWEKAGKIKSNTIGGKRLYKRGDLLNSLKRN